MLLNQKGIARLLSNQDFVEFVTNLEEEHAATLAALLVSNMTSVTHQLQGETRKLGEILKAIRSSNPALPRA